MILSSGWRKIWLTMHVMSSLGWFGAVAVFLTLALVGMTSQDTQLVKASYLAMKLTGWFVIVPFAFVSLGSGIVSSLGTKWGLFRYYWVLLKLVITIGATFLLMVHTQAIDLLADIAAKTTVLSVYPYGMQLKMVVTSGATVVVLIMLTGLAVYKPRGMTPYGQRKQRQGTAQKNADSPVRATILK
ncbi:hypothetical protein KSF_112010 [Reticulibacter mediterranei]|uniref:DUF2269 domain-containing protein n=1 Tax=Reticulibacter mediterranei TaxID=2778369 RepID=A0A8J3N9T7_9CHLR|nr:hypothetical protein [Reticulibacter mediterranei]GHP01154.1 hypothetical protein KSF_112010 [Reticulibacter mediterranei]